MKKKLLCVFFTLCNMVLNAQEWTDVTDYYFNNANLEQGFDGWYGYTPNTRTQGAFSYNQRNYIYFGNEAESVKAGTYRLTAYAFYRMGTAEADYSLYTTGKYQDKQYALMITPGGNFPIVNAASEATATPPEGNNTNVGNGLYIPSDTKTAAEWFKQGYYANSVEFKFDRDVSILDFYIYKGNFIQNDWLVFGGIKLEYKGAMKHIENIILTPTNSTLVPTEKAHIDLTYTPTDATIAQFYWSSSNSDIVSVDNYGEIKALKPGKVTITAKSRHNDVIGTCEITVEQPVLASNENIVINEIMQSNVDCIMDPSYNYGSWLELYNPSNETVGLEKIYVTDDPDNLKKNIVKLEEKFIKSKGFVTLFFDHYDGVFAPYQIDFKLNYDGGTIYITNGTEILASMEYPKGKTRMAYARVTDGNDTWSWTALPTPSRENALSIYADAQVSEPTISEEGGLFEEDKEIHISVPEGAYLTFTTNGSVPTMFSKQVINSDTTIVLSKKTLCLRLRAFKDGYLPSNVVTRTFIYKDKNYVFPIMAITSDDEHLTGQSYGIFTEGIGYGRPGNGQSYNCNWNADWDRPANFEYITDKGEYALNQEVDISTCGGWSRAWTPHSFKLKAAKYYDGLNSMDYQFFKDKPYLKHKTLQIRNGGNDNTYRIKDAAVQEIVRQSGLHVNTQAWQPVHVFFNGKYQTVLNMREPNNKHYAYSNYGYDTDEIDQFEMSPDSGYVQKNGTPDKFLELYDLSQNADDPETYEKICNLLDIDEYINYMAVEFYIKNRDWPQNNIKGFRSQHDGKFHFVLFDLDQQNEVSGNPFTTFANKKNYTFDNLRGNDITPWNTGDQITAEIKFVTIFIGLLKNETFRKQFIDTFCLIGGSAFRSANVTDIVTPMRDYMNKGMALTQESCSAGANSVISRFNSTYYNSLIDNLKTYKGMALQSTKSISCNFKSNIPEAELFVNGIKIPTGTFEGTLFLPAKLKAVAPAGYKFLGWSKFTFTDIIETDPEIELTSASSRYYARWEKMTDEEMIANGISAKPIVINEVSASNSIYVNDYFKKADWIELYNSSDEEVDIRGMYLSDNLDMPEKYQVPEDDALINTIIPAHGYKVIWCDKKDNISNDIHANFKLENEGGNVMITKYDDSELVFADTLNYQLHDGTQSFGRYPDGFRIEYLMDKPTPGAPNKGNVDAYSQIEELHTITNIDNCSVTDDNIVIAYVGEGKINIKSNNSQLKTAEIYSATGTKLASHNISNAFETLNMTGFPTGIYIIKATDIKGGSAMLKFILK